MRWIEVSVDTPAELIDERCQQMADMGADGFVIENEADFQNFLENNHQYWDYVDDELEQKFAGVSRIKCYLSDDADGKAILAKIRGAYGAVQTAFIEDSDWENNWREYYKPIEVGEKLVVVPEWEEIPADGRQPRSKNTARPRQPCSTSAAEAAYSASAVLYLAAGAASAAI